MMLRCGVESLTLWIRTTCVCACVCGRALAGGAGAGAAHRLLPPRERSRAPQGPSPLALKFACHTLPAQCRGAVVNAWSRSCRCALCVIS
eukprot:1905861-Rhodomonas_salina.1